jgi:outer membrane protein assembly factor BamB
MGSRAAFASAGDREWVRRYDGPAHKRDTVEATAMSPDGSRVFVTGQSYSDDTSNDIETIAYEPTSGDELWRARFDWRDAGSDRPTALAVSPDGTRVFVTGDSYPRPYVTYHVVVLAYDAATGTLLWGRGSEDPDVRSTGRAIAVSPDGGHVFVTGMGTRTDDNTNIRTVAYDASDGTKEWTRVFDEPGHDTDIATSMALSPDGSHVFVAGESGPINVDTDWIVLSYDANRGAFEWVHRIDGPSHAVDIVYAMAVSARGDHIYVAGSLTRGGTEIGATVALDAMSGEQTWGQFVSPQPDAFGADHAVAVSPDGSRVFVTAGVTVQADTTMVTVAYDSATGQEIWRDEFENPLRNVGGYALALSADGARLFVQGTGYSASFADFATVTYVASTGALLWSRRYDSPAHLDDSSANIRVTPDGLTVIVAGSCTGVDSEYDFATVAYAA